MRCSGPGTWLARLLASLGPPPPPPRRRFSARTAAVRRPASCRPAARALGSPAAAPRVAHGRVGAGHGTR